MSQTTANLAGRPLRVLSLDGGGVRGISSLMILQEIMEKLRLVNGLEQIPRPCDHFDLIGGTSTGGIIAIMLGRLGMTVEQCLQAYTKMAQMAFTPKRGLRLPASPSGAFSAQALETAIKQTVREYCTDPGCVAQRERGQPTTDTCTHEEMEFRSLSCTKTVVLAITEVNIDAPPTLFKTHDTSSDSNGCTIWQIARATSAATTFFKPIKVGQMQISYVDAGFGYNNPCDVLIREAEQQFPERKEMQILSIGTGLGDVVALDDTRKSILKALKKMASSSKKVAFSLKRRFGDSGQYYRFNVDIGLKDVTLSDWEKSSKIAGHTKNYLADVESEINKFVDALAGVTQAVPVPQPVPELGSETRNVVHYLPFSKNRRFVARKAVLDTLNRMLFTQPGTNRVSLVGLGGMGKTQIALHFAHWVKENRLGCSVLWVPALSTSSFEQACAEIQKKLAISDIDTKDSKEVVRRYLSSEKAGDWLLIVDNADDIDVLWGSSGETQGIHQFLPDSDRGRILFTTRSQEVSVRAAAGDVVELKPMSSGEAKAILDNWSVEKSQLQDERVVAQFLEKLTFLPLAIAQAAAYMSINKIVIAEYLGLCESKDQEMVELLSSGFHDSAHYSSSQNAVATTWIISFDQIREKDAPAANILSFISHIEPKAIPRWILPEMESEQQLTKAIGTLCGYGFLSRRGDGEIFEMHRLVHLATRIWTDKKNITKQTGQDAAQRLAAVFPTAHWENRALWQQCLPHALRLLQNIEATDDSHVCVLSIRIGGCLNHDGRNKEAVGVLERTFSWQKTLLPSDHYKLELQYVLGAVYLSNGQNNIAIQVLEEVVATGKDTFTEEDTTRLNSEDTLVRAYQLNGRMEEAIQLLEHVVDVRAKTQPEEHRDRLSSQSNLALAYRHQGQMEKAVHLYEYVVDVRTKTLPEEHPDLLSSQNNLASIYRDMGQTEEAVKLFEHVVAIRAKVQPEEHPDRLSSQEHLALIYRDMGQTEKAVQLLEHVVDVRTKTLPEENPDRLSSQEHLALKYQDMGQTEEAVQLLEHVVDVRTKTLPEEHPNRLTSQYNLAAMYQHKGRKDEAIELMEHVVAVRCRILPETNGDRVNSKQWLRHMYEVRGAVEK
ncbi:hypothetical protein B0J13DRAFT_506566 [Dactylonectria estremocensis]|uniref:PNPLA domain-containing protein n=1 Tax=Dactylonectria estremocensis TaxID=1079267 RepID=A0A9P9EGS9_9HYPO|nr:hypothetical protein B0J13DRAFT_506566 [Dactylonectria estremocensis]